MTTVDEPDPAKDEGSSPEGRLHRDAGLGKESGPDQEDTHGQTHWQVLFSKDHALPMIGIMVGVLLHALNAFIVIALLPTAVEDIGGLSYYALNTSAYVLASILASALASRALQAAGPRNAYLAAAAVFALGSLVCALAPSMPVLIAGRFLQGLGGGLLLSLSYALVRISFPSHLWGPAIAIESSMWGVATLCGPAIGGIFAEFGLWRMPFWLMIPVSAGVALMSLWAFPAHTKEEGASRMFATPQLLLLASAVLAVSLGSLAGSVLVGAALFLVGIIFLLSFAAVERRASVRLLPFGAVTRTTSLGRLYALAGLLILTVSGTGVFVTYFLQTLHGLTPLIAGYFGVLVAAGWTSASMLLSHWTGERARFALVIAPAMAAAGAALLVIVMPGPGVYEPLPVGAIGLGLFVIGAGIGTGWPHLMTAVFNNAPEGEGDLASTSIATVQLAASALGATSAGLIANLSGLADPGGLTGAAQASIAVYAAFTVPALAGVFIALPLRGALSGKS